MKKMKKFTAVIAAAAVAVTMVMSGMQVMAQDNLDTQSETLIKPLTFTATEDGSTVTFYWKSADDVQYSQDGGTDWQEYTAGTKITLDTDDTLSFKGTNCITGTFEEQHFLIDGAVEASGDVTSLVNEVGGDVKLADYEFVGLFHDCTGLTEAPELPSTILSEGCYAGMFEGCTSLETVPELIAKTTTDYCYQNMFKNCTSLLQSPKLEAAVVNKYSYQAMFLGCTSLLKAGNIEAVKVLEGGCFTMFMNCTSLEKAPDLEAISLGESCYASMFQYCSSLVKAPKLPATKMADLCYSSMFTYCTSLTDAPKLESTKLAQDCYNSMFQGCESLEEAPELPATTLEQGCYQLMFDGCVSLEEAPELPATKLATTCYNGMFRGCESLKEAPELPATELASTCYASMFEECTSLTELPELPATELTEACYAEMFLNCTGLKLYETGYGESWMIPEGAVAAQDWNTRMFTNTSGEFTGDPQIGQKYYYKQKVNPTITVKTSKVTYNVKSCTKKTYTFNIGASANSKGKLSYKLTGANKNARKYLSLNAKTGKITVKAGTPKGKYTFKIKISVEETNKYLAGYKNITVQVTVK